MKFIDLFSGVGGFTRGLELAGHKCIGHWIFIEDRNMCAAWSEKYGCYIAIRKLTPKECFRLQGWEDEYFERAEQFNSNSQLYKQAGNGVTVSVVKAIGEKIKRMEKENV